MIQCPFCANEVDALIQPDEQVRLFACPSCLNALALRRVGADLQAAPVEGVQDIRMLAPQGSVMQGIFATLDGALENLPVLPQIPQRIMAMVHDPLTSMSDLAQVVNEDPAIAVKILKVANSAYFGGVSEFTDLNVACARLGLRNIANTVLAITNSSLYRTRDARFLDFMQRLWRHAVATAHCAQEIASLAAESRSDVPFLAGLVHEIGKLALFNMVTVKYTGSIGRLRESTDLLQRVLDRFHPLVGLHVIQRWDLPPEFRITTFCHTKPATVPADPWRRMTHIIALACAVAHVSGFGFGERSEDALFEHPSAQVLGLTPDQLNELVEGLKERLESLLEVLAVA